MQLRSSFIGRLKSFLAGLRLVSSDALKGPIPRSGPIKSVIALATLLLLHPAASWAQDHSDSDVNLPEARAGFRRFPLPRPPIHRPINIPGIPPVPPVSPGSPTLPTSPSLPVPPIPQLPIARIEGPIPLYFYVTDYGAVNDPNGVVDDTAGIQAAMNAVCADQTKFLGGITPVLFFPPGIYPVQQPQLPSTNSPLDIPCTFSMQGAGLSGGAQFGEMAHGAWILVKPGPNPNAAALMTFRYPVRPVISNLTIEGYNQAVAIIGTAPNVFEDVCLSASATGMPDNTPLKVTDTFWIFFTNGCLEAIGSKEVPVALFTAEDLGPDFPRTVGSVYFTNVITAGGGFQYIQRVAPNQGPPGGWVFRNVAMEIVRDIFTISQTCTGCTNWIFSNITFDTVESSDSDCPACSIINLNAPDVRFSGVVIENSFAGNQGKGRAITVNAGRLENYRIDSCLTYCVDGVIDQNGNPVWKYVDKVTLSGGTKTLTFFPVIFEHGPPICVVNDESTINGAKITMTDTAMTITGGPSDVVDYACYDNFPYPR
jgi:hypothetical protein